MKRRSNIPLLTSATAHWRGAAIKSLASLFFEKAGKLSDKWEHYLSIYEVELSPYICAETPINLLEIGVQNGGSLELWADYLPPGSRIVGIDIDSRVGALSFPNQNVSVIVHDATDAEGLRPILGNSTFDIIIDDGSHISSDVIKSFEYFFDHLAPGGKFIIEDLHASYYPSHNGGFRTPGSAIERLKSVIDALNADHIDPDAELSDHERLLMKRLNPLVARITFYDSVVVVEKLRSAKTRPYRRIFGGTEAPVTRPADSLFKISAEHLETILFAHPAARHLETSLVDELSVRQSEIEELRIALEDKDRQLDAVRRSAMEREAGHLIETSLPDELSVRQPQMEDLRVAGESKEPQLETSALHRGDLVGQPCDDTRVICARVLAALNEP